LLQSALDGIVGQASEAAPLAPAGSPFYAKIGACPPAAIALMIGLARISGSGLGGYSPNTTKARSDGP